MSRFNIPLYTGSSKLSSRGSLTIQIVRTANVLQDSTGLNRVAVMFRLKSEETLLSRKRSNIPEPIMMYFALWNPLSKMQLHKRQFPV